MIRKHRLYPAVDHISRASADKRIVRKHKPVPKAEHIIRNLVYRPFGLLFAVWSFLLDYLQPDKIFDVCRAYIGVLAYLRGDLRKP